MPKVNNLEDWFHALGVKGIATLNSYKFIFKLYDNVDKDNMDYISIVS